MRLRLIIISLITSLCQIGIYSLSTAQVFSNIKPLTIGDTVPDIIFDHVLNYKDTAVKLSDFCHKPVILDFFSTWCTVCIGALPKLDSLQRTFDDSLQILVVDYEPADKVEKFLKNNKIGQGVSLPFVAEDSLLSYILFPHRTVPHEVWIDANRVVRAITTKNYVTTQNLQELIDRKSLHLPLKWEQMDFDNRKPLFVDGNGGSADQIRFRSTLTRYIDGLGTGTSVPKGSTTVMHRYINQSIVHLYQQTQKDAIGNKFILEVKDKARYINDGSLFWDQWARKNAYSYEMIAPVNTPDSVLRLWMLQDLNRWLHLNARWEKRRVHCWALVMKSKTDALFKTRGGKPKLQYGADNAGHPFPVKIFYNQPFSTVVEAFNWDNGFSLVPIVLDETHYTGNVDLKLKAKNIHDIPALRKALQPYGLDLIPVERELKMFVITENDYKPPPADMN